MADGWVRCGRCKQVFDARDRLERADSAAVPTLVDVAGNHARAADPGLREPGLDAPGFDDFQPRQDAGQEAAREPQLAPIKIAAAEGHVFQPGQDSSDFEPGLLDAPAEEQIEPVLDSLGPADDDLHADFLPSFVISARRRNFWQKTSVRIFLSLVLLLLILALILQYLLHTRNEWVARYPQLAPQAEKICRYLSCQIEPLRQRDALLIDGSGFKRISENEFSLFFAVENQAAYPIATPAVDLTLSDAQGRVLLRRVLEPQAWDVQTVLQARERLEVQNILRVDLQPQAAQVAGYRIELFYP